MPAIETRLIFCEPPLADIPDVQQGRIADLRDDESWTHGCDESRCSATSVATSGASLTLVRITDLIDEGFESGMVLGSGKSVGKVGEA
mmetsp:Transcript_18311/g.46873  ORF Transcript_18311/g.46873 Transcript_18311/m.46873 type:complete len:88 (-) Transcript_18311:18-281(-)